MKRRLIWTNFWLNREFHNIFEVIYQERASIIEFIINYLKNHVNRKSSLSDPYWDFEKGPIFVSFREKKKIKRNLDGRPCQKTGTKYNNDPKIHSRFYEEKITLWRKKRRKIFFET